MPQSQIQWDSRCWARILSDRLSDTVQKRGIVLVDGGDEQGWSIGATEGHMGGIDMHIEG
jgi:hypothetical protein